jgi:hypothetical protein
MLYERVSLSLTMPGERPPDDLYEPHAREIAQAVLPVPVPCCADWECDAYTASMRWWRVQIGLRRSISALNDLIDDHDATEGANCLPGDMQVQASGLEAGYRRWYEGEIVRVNTASGHKLSITPNHPILTTRGWRSAKALSYGDELLCSALGEEMGIGDPDVDGRPATIRKVFDALSRTGTRERRATSHKDFHGDGSSGEVDIVWANRLLRGGTDAERAQPAGEGVFPLTNVAPAPLFVDRLAVEFLGRSAPASRGLVSACGDRLALSGTHPPSDHPVGFSGGTQHHALRDEHALERTPRNVEAERESFFGFTVPIPPDEFLALLVRDLEWAVPSGGADVGTCFVQEAMNGSDVEADRVRQVAHGSTSLVTADKVVEVERTAFAGHVFNLQTATGVYMAEGVLVHNCRCRNVVESRAMRGGLVVLWQRTARLLEQMRAQAEAQEGEGR